MSTSPITVTNPPADFSNVVFSKVAGSTTHPVSSSGDGTSYNPSVILSKDTFQNGLLDAFANVTPFGRFTGVIFGASALMPGSLLAGTHTWSYRLGYATPSLLLYGGLAYYFLWYRRKRA